MLPGRYDEFLKVLSRVGKPSQMLKLVIVSCHVVSTSTLSLLHTTLNRTARLTARGFVGSGSMVFEPFVQAYCSAAAQLHEFYVTPSRPPCP